MQMLRCCTCKGLCKETVVVSGVFAHEVLQSLTFTSSGATGASSAAPFADSVGRALKATASAAAMSAPVRAGRDALHLLSTLPTCVRFLGWMRTSVFSLGILHALNMSHVAPALTNSRSMEHMDANSGRLLLTGSNILQCVVLVCGEGSMLCAQHRDHLR